MRPGLTTIALFLIALLSAVSGSSYDYLDQTPDERIIYLIWDAYLDPEFTAADNVDNEVDLIFTMLSPAMIEEFYQPLSEGLGMHSYKRDKATQLGINPGPQDVLRFELTDPRTIRVRMMFNSTEGFDSGYQNFLQTTTDASLDAIVSGNSELRIKATRIAHRILGVHAVLSWYIPKECGNYVQDDNESDVDCGGESKCNRCWIGQSCVEDSDCVEFSECIDIDAETKYGTCSSLNFDARPRGFEASRTGGVGANNTGVCFTAFFAILCFSIAIVFF